MPSNPPLANRPLPTPPAPRKTRSYMVTRRFGMGPLLLLTAAFAVLFGVLRRYDAPPFLYIYLGLQAMVIVLAQMWFGTTPRIASMVSGALLLPASSILTAFITGFGSQAIAVAIGSSPCLAVSGAVMGYMTGTLLAGCFLINDTLMEFIAGRTKQRNTDADKTIVEAELVPFPAAPEARPPSGLHGDEPQSETDRQEFGAHPAPPNGRENKKKNGDGRE